MMYSIIGFSLTCDFVILCGSNLILLVRMLCGPRRLPSTRLYVTIGLSVLVFLLCGLPIGILRTFSAKVQFQNQLSNFKAIERIAFLLSSVSSTANPIIYFFVGSCRQKQQQRQWPRSLKLVLQKALEEADEGGNSGDCLPPESMEKSESP